jgi:hypothetical protein
MVRWLFGCSDGVHIVMERFCLYRGESPFVFTLKICMAEGDVIYYGCVWFIRRVALPKIWLAKILVDVSLTMNWPTLAKT